MGKRTQSRFIQGISRVAGAIVGKREQPTEPPAAEAKPPERRRDSRSDIEIPGRKNDFVRVLVKGSSENLLVNNLSMRGLCIYIDRHAHVLPEVGGECEAEIFFGEDSVPAKIYVAHRADEIAGCHVIDPSGAWIKAVSKVLDPIRMGRRLREIDPNFVRQDGGPLTVRWFQSGPACDLYVWSNAETAIVKAQLFFDWLIVEWTAERGLRSGQANSPPGRSGGHPTADLFEFTEDPDPEILSDALRLVNAAKELPEEIRRLFL